MVLRAAARRFVGWNVVPLSPGHLAFECIHCDYLVCAQTDQNLAPQLDILLDHDWTHDPENVGAPNEEIDARVDGPTD